MRAISREVRNDDGDVESGEDGINGPRGELWWQIESPVRQEAETCVSRECTTLAIISITTQRQNFEIVIQAWSNVDMMLNGEPSMQPITGCHKQKSSVYSGYKRSKTSPVLSGMAFSDDGTTEFEWLKKKALLPLHSRFFRNKSSTSNDATRRIRQESLSFTMLESPDFAAMKKQLLLSR